MNRHLFFDLDRTLWDFERNSESALRFLFEATKDTHHLPSFHRFLLVYKEVNAKLWKKYGKGKITKEELRDTRFLKTFRKFDLINEELSNYFNEQYLEISPLQTLVFPNTQETLETLKGEGYHMHIITNGFKEVQLTKLKNCNLIDYFNVIVSSEELGVNKPDVRIFQHAMDLAGATPDGSVMIGDDWNVDVMGAERAGMRAIHFDPEEEMSNKNVDIRIRNLNEIPALLPFLFR